MSFSQYNSYHTLVRVPSPPLSLAPLRKFKGSEFELSLTVDCSMEHVAWSTVPERIGTCSENSSEDFATW